MKTRRQFATATQRAAWQAECQREATKRMLRRLMKQLSRVAQEPVPVGEHRLAQEYRLLRAQHVKALRLDKLRRDEEVIECVQAQTGELQLELV